MQKRTSLTITSPTRPYSSHKVPNSNSLPNISVWAQERRMHRRPSRSFDGAVHLGCNDGEHVSTLQGYYFPLPCTPTLNNTGEECLLWVIGNIRSKPINSSPEVSIRAADNLRLGHGGLEIFKNFC